ncbi:SDR family oxidoreductase [Rhodocaloribacter litoris]|uniref:SDR family oxidoreductase n=1 Tax=Rhodocaloribacter litoris TaxID=2558931 RepID=UPI00141EF45C|nr:SDR family oxidoreductase [Rhodocaloribacter litoris]QXD16661.1 SDR family oxidoreductase [Rhodocaloribacter litoris]
MEKPTLLVTGASGHLGRRVVERLLERGAGPVIATTRHPEKLADLAARGVDVRPADFDRPETLPPAFDGADRLLLISTDAVDRPGRRFEQHRNAIDAAVRVGVRHIVYTSLFGVAPGSPITIADDHLRTEQALEAGGVGFTALRNNLYTDLLLMSLPPAVASGKLYAAAGDGGAAYVTREDCARAAAAALASDFEGTRRLEISGPAVVTYHELAALASELSGRPVEYVPVDVEAYVAGAVAAGLPEPVARMMASFDVAMQRGLLGPATDAVRELTGHPPTSVRAFLEAHRAALVPSPRA